MGFVAGPYLPEHILIVEVLHRLPVKTLGRFRCVSKTWHHVIASSSFVNTHLTYHQKHSFKKYILYQNNLVCSLLTNHDSIFDLREISKQHTNPYLSWSYKYDFLFRDGVKVYGTCNGLLCFSNRSYRIGDPILLWNPTCYKVKKLPKIDHTDGVRFTRTASVSFGYYNEDHKVVVIAPIDDTYVVFVYSLSTNSWNTVCPNFHHHIPFHTGDDKKKAIEYTGFVDCTAYMTTRNQVTCFDLRDETFQVIDFPFLICGAEAYGETIAIFACEHSYPSRSSMWILKDRVSSTSLWERKCVFDLQGVAVGLVGVGFLNNGKYVARALRDKEGIDKFFVCDLESQKLSQLGSVHGDNPLYIISGRIHSNYVESLLLLNEEGFDVPSSLRCLKFFNGYAKKDVSSTTEEQPTSSLDLEEAASEFNLAKVEGNDEAELRLREERTAEAKVEGNDEAELKLREERTAKHKEATERKVEKRAEKAPQMVSKLMIQKKKNYCACARYACTALFVGFTSCLFCCLVNKPNMHDLR